MMTRTIEEINEIFRQMEYNTFEKLTHWYDQWIFRESEKTNFNYWLKKAGITKEEFLLWEEQEY